MVSHFRDKVKPFFNFFFTFFSRHKLLADWLFAWDEGVLCYLQGAADEASVIGSVDFTHCFSLTHWEYDSRKDGRSQELFSFFFHVVSH